MKLVRVVGAAFAAYSALPMSRREWSGEEMRLSLRFLPLVGVFIGGVSFLWYLLCSALGWNGVLFAAVFTCIPLLLTGGLHMDGFMDTVDALASHQERERMLAIMKDPHAGAFAILAAGVYLLLYFGFSYTLYQTGAVPVVCAGYTLSRALAACAAATLPRARQNGMLHTFAPREQQKGLLSFALAFAVCAMGGMLVIGWRGVGASVGMACAIGGIVCGLPCLCWYARFARRKFGGATGDTTGYCLQLLELLIIIGTTLGCYVGGVQ